jgi:hypothetical protein
MTHYPFRVDTELWSAYKDTVPRSQKLDEPLMRFVIKRVIEEQGRDAVPQEALEWYEGGRDDPPRDIRADA